MIFRSNSTAASAPRLPLRNQAEAHNNSFCDTPYDLEKNEVILEKF
jgi:hypothetical protein